MIDLICIASGPSLTAGDCEAVRLFGKGVVAVNNSWKMVPWCDYIFAGDLKWWRAYHRELNIQAERWTSSTAAAKTYKVNFFKASGPFNSGMRAIQWGIWKGFKDILLLGYDCSLKNGIHWHGPHDERRALKNPNAKKVCRWHSQFEQVAIDANKKGVLIRNCSRYSEMACFPRAKLEDVLTC